MKPVIRIGFIHGLIALIVLSSFWMIYAFGVNVPHWDDHAIKKTVEEFSWSKIPGLFNFHNEHRIFFTRVVQLTTTKITGELNFKYLMFIGQFGLVGLFTCYFFIARQFKLPAILLLIIALFIFNFSTYENSLWGMAAAQNHWVLLWTIASLFFLTSNTKYSKFSFEFAVSCSLIALLTAGNGILTGPIGLLVLLTQNRKKELAKWFVLHLVFLILYFIGFSKNGTVHPDIEKFFLNLFNLSGSLIFPFFKLEFIFSLVRFFGMFNLALGLLVTFKLFFEKGSNEKLVIFLALQAFYIGTLALVAFSRNDYQIINLLSSKYKIYSFLILGTSVFFGYNFLKKDKWKLVILISCLMLFFNTQLSHINLVKNHHEERVAETLLLKHSVSDFSKGYYRPPNFSFEKYLNPERSVFNPDKVDSIAFSNQELLFFEDKLVSDSENYIWLKSKNSERLVSFNLSACLLFGEKRGIASLNLLNFETGIYEVYFLEISPSETKLYNTNKTLRIEGIPFTEAPKNW